MGAVPVRDAAAREFWLPAWQPIGPASISLSMRRSLVQGDDIARHPFLQSLPRHVRHASRRARAADLVRRRNRIALREALAERRAGATLAWRRWRSEGRITMQDLRDFLLAYCACFVAVMAFIA